MTKNLSIVFVLALGVAASGTLAARPQDPAPPAKAGRAARAADGKIPITTSSSEARAEFLKGRELAEKLRGTDAIAHFQRAAELDPNLALAELNLSNFAPTGKEVFEHLNRAVRAADKASKGERLLVLATQAGANNDARKQHAYLEELVAAYPSDERAHFNLGAYYFGQQEFAKAISHYKKATEIAPDYSGAYNILGYSYRQEGDFASAEKAFQKYVELIPKDPNPYDSYGELLLKMGRFDESIAQYRKALAIDPHFTNAHQGIAMDLLYSGKPDEAVAELGESMKMCRIDGERRAVLFALTIVHLDGGDTTKALADVDQQYALGEKTNDVPSMLGDRALRGNILLTTGQPDRAREEFEASLKLLEDSNLSPELKDNAKIVQHFNLARVALAKKDFAAAKSEAAEFRKGVAASKNPLQAKFVHELDGMLALEEKDYGRAIAELKQANSQNPRNLYRLCEAYGATGDKPHAAEACKAAASFNSMPDMNFALVRTKAKAASAATTKS